MEKEQTTKYFHPLMWVPPDAVCAVVPILCRVSKESIMVYKNDLCPFP